MTIFLNDLPSKESVMENMQKMNSFGSRLKRVRKVRTLTRRG